MPHIRDPVTGLCVVCDRGKKSVLLTKYGNKKQKAVEKHSAIRGIECDVRNQNQINSFRNQTLKVMIVNPEVLNNKDLFMLRNSSDNHNMHNFGMYEDFHEKSHRNTNTSMKPGKNNPRTFPNLIKRTLPNFSRKGQNHWSGHGRLEQSKKMSPIFKPNDSKGSPSPNYTLLNPEIVYVPVIPPIYNDFNCHQHSLTQPQYVPYNFRDNRFPYYRENLYDDYYGNRVEPKFENRKYMLVRNEKGYGEQVSPKLFLHKNEDRNPLLNSEMENKKNLSRSDINWDKQSNTKKIRFLDETEENSPEIPSTSKTKSRFCSIM